MFVNDCWGNSHAQCALKNLGRFSFQPLAENPLLGPSASALDDMGALRERYFIKDHQLWRLFTSPCLHAGVVHLVISLSSVIFVGVHLEQEYGPLIIGIIYILSAIFGSSVATLFIQDRSSVASSSALFGLLGTTLSGLVWNWKVYTKKLPTLIIFFIILTVNMTFGLMPYVNNFANIGGFICGFLAGFVLPLKPQVGKTHKTKGVLFDYHVNFFDKVKKKLDRPILRSAFLVILILLFAGVLVAVLQGINVNKYCGWCHYIDCVPLKWWTCGDKTMGCESMISSEQLTLTCPRNGKFRVFPFRNITQARVEDLCYLTCS